MSRHHFPHKRIIPEAFRGNCDCGRWLIIPKKTTKDNNISCECGYFYYYEDEKYHRTGKTNKDLWLKE